MFSVFATCWQQKSFYFQSLIDNDIPNIEDQSIIATSRGSSRDVYRLSLPFLCNFQEKSVACNYPFSRANPMFL